MRTRQRDRHAGQHLHDTRRRDHSARTAQPAGEHLRSGGHRHLATVLRRRLRADLHDLVPNGRPGRFGLEIDSRLPRRLDHLYAVQPGGEHVLRVSGLLAQHSRRRPTVAHPEGQNERYCSSFADHSQPMPPRHHSSLTLSLQFCPLTTSLLPLCPCFTFPSPPLLKPPLSLGKRSSSITKTLTETCIFATFSLRKLSLTLQFSLLERSQFEFSISQIKFSLFKTSPIESSFIFSPP